MSRAVLLSTCGDPFTTSLCLRLWKERWYDEINHFYVNFNNHCKVPDEVVGEFMKNWASEPKMTIIYHPEGKGNGPPQVELLKICEQDLVMLLEEDGFIFTSGVVSEWFNLIDPTAHLYLTHDIVGSPRYATGEVAEAAKKKYNLDYSGIGDKGFGFWPNFFVTRKDLLMKTDLDFGSKKYPKGEYFKELDHTFEEDCYTDTATWMNLQLRYLGVKSFDIPQYHVHPEDTIDKFELFKDPTYLHGGSLSSGWGGYLSGRDPEAKTDMEKKELETRCAFWKLAADQTDGYVGFKKEYLAGIENLITNSNLDRNRIQDKYNLYKRTMNL